MTDLTPLRQFLSDARETPVGLSALADQWRMTRVRVMVPGAAGLTRNPNTAAKLRGAWGRQLALGASAEALAGAPCPWPAPCAYDLFFNAQGHAASGIEIPKPFVMALEPAGRALQVDLTLFGQAGDWAGEAADALVRALRGGLDMAGDIRLPLEPAGRDITQSVGQPLPDAACALRLTFLTPLILRQGAGLVADPETLVRSLAFRIGGLALWHGVALQPDRAALERAAAIAAGAVWQDGALQEWRRGSAAQGRRMPMAGVLGRIEMEGGSDVLAALVALGAVAHAGSRSTLGMGRYVLDILA